MNLCSLPFGLYDWEKGAPAALGKFASDSSSKVVDSMFWPLPPQPLGFRMAFLGFLLPLLASSSTLSAPTLSWVTFMSTVIETRFISSGILMEDCIGLNLLTPALGS